MNPAGSYTLASVNGRDVPAVWNDITAFNGDRIRSLWVGGQVVFCPAGCYKMTLESALVVGDRTDPLGQVATEGRLDSRWQVSSDQSVLVAKAHHTPGERTVFVFLRD